MADNQLKIRIQLPQSADGTEPIDQHVPKSPQKEVDKNEYLFDWRKIFITLILVTAILVWIGYSINQWLNDVSSPDNDSGQQTSTENATNETSATGNTLQTPKSEIPTDVDAVIQLSPERSPADNTQNQPPALINIPVPRPKPAEFQHQSQPSSFSSPSQSIAAIHENVVRAQLTSAINEREPIDTLNEVWLDNGVSKRIFFFIQLHNQGGRQVSVHWYYGAEEVAMVNLNIGNQNWRTNSSKLLSNHQLGKWHVTLVDQNGRLLAQKDFVVNERSA